MLMIKKRYPKRKLIYGGAAFIGSFALAVTLLASNHANLNHILANTPWQQKEASEVAQNDEQPTSSQPAATEDPAPEASQGSSQADASWTATSHRAQSSSPQTNTPAEQSPAATQPTTPAEETQEPAPVTPQPSSDTEADSPTKDETGLIEEVVDLLIVPNES